MQNTRQSHVLQTRLNPAEADTRRRLAAMSFGVLLPLGLAWRLAPLHLPPFAFKYGGSALWAAAVYWTLVLLLPRWRVVKVAILALVVATAVEFLKRLYWPPLDHFRETLAGKLLLGRYFTYGAIAAYWLAIVLTALIDARWHARKVRPAPSHSPLGRKV